MTREEAIAVFKAFMDNPLFSDVHKAAFSIAMHDIKQRHEWGINKLMLVPKTEWEQEPIIDRIRAEIVDLGQRTMNDNRASGIWACRDIIDKYKAKSEVEDGNVD